MHESLAARELTEGSLLNGKIRYRQFTAGHRSGFEPIVLAASIAARAGEHILEAGCGAGAALLCLAYRIPGIYGLGAEIDPGMAALANENFKINSLDGVFSICSNIEQPSFARTFDHAMANPPWHDGSGTQSPDPLRALAHQTSPSLLLNWINSLTAHLKPRGSLTLILPAASFSEAATFLRDSNFGAITLFPLWPHAGRPAKLILMTGKRGARSPDKLLSGLILHNQSGVTPAAQAIFRDGAAIIL